MYLWLVTVDTSQLGVKDMTTEGPIRTKDVVAWRPKDAIEQLMKPVPAAYGMGMPKLISCICLGLAPDGHYETGHDYA